MKIKKIVFVIILVSIPLILISCSNYFLHSPKNVAETVQNPFEIAVSPPKIERTGKQVFEGESLVQKDGEENRLAIEVSISNLTEQDYKNVWYELKLNSEVEPFIASKILKFSSNKFYVTAKEKVARQSQQVPSNASGLRASGFEHRWRMLITSKEELKEYYHASPEEIGKALRSITVTIKWQGGSQEQTVPISLSDEEMKKIL